MRLAQGDVEASGSVAEKTGVCVTDVKQYTQKNPPSRSLNTKNLPKRMFKKSFISFSFFFNSKEYHCNSLRFPHAVKLSVSANI